MIHPFHPLYNQTFPLLDCRLTWGEARVYFHDATGALVHLPAPWTDAAPADPFVVMGAGRAYVRLEDLRTSAGPARWAAGDGPRRNVDVLSEFCRTVSQITPLMPGAICTKSH